MAKWDRIFTSIKVISMKVIEKDLIVSGNKCGTFCAYEEIEPELLVTPDTPKMSRVLPAPFFYEKRLFFYLVNRVEPGSKPGFPNGGFEVRDEGGALRSFDLDQVIIHPHVIKHQKTLDKMARKAEKERAKRERQYKKAARDAAKPKNTTGKRGRPALDPAVKAAREAEMIARSQRSGGKRGRPKSTEVKEVSALKPSGGRRGRPALTPEARAAKAQAKAIVRARSGGKRGRPKRK
jgi:hypothetical protein